MNLLSLDDQLGAEFSDEFERGTLRLSHRNSKNSRDSRLSSVSVRDRPKRVIVNNNLKSDGWFIIDSDNRRTYWVIYKSLLNLHLYLFLNYFLTFSVFPAISLKPKTIL